jgi:3-hydroxymyristoyl/3-hydroxydecanoyl-(acyl carrier protein) dehydratase
MGETARWVETPLSVPRDHAAFAGHFPGHPILPGAVLLAETLAAIEGASGRAPTEWTLSSAKFLEPVAPGTALTLAHDLRASGAIRFEIRSAAGVVASGTLAPREPR